MRPRSSRAELVLGGFPSDAVAEGEVAEHALVRDAQVAPVSDRSPWVNGPVWDGVWLLSALWLVPLVLWLARGFDDPQESPLDVLYFGISAAFWIGHRLCSTYVAYATEAYRPLLRAQPLRFVILPLLVALACFAIFLPPDDALPWDRMERFVALAIVDYVFVTQHFAAQHFGVLSLYRLRAGRAASRGARRLDRWFALGIGGVLVVLADVLTGSVAYQDAWVGRAPWVDRLAAVQDEARVVALVVAAAAVIVMLIAELRTGRPSLPRVLYAVGVASMVVVALAPRSPFLFLVVWTSQHWIVATGLASRTAIAEPVPLRGLVRRALHAVNARPWAVALLLMLVSVALLPVFEVEASFDGGRYYGDWIFGSLAEGLRSSTWVPALLALGFATGFNHYLLDRNVYRFSDPRVRSAAQGLIAGTHLHARSHLISGRLIGGSQ